MMRTMPGAVLTTLVLAGVAHAQTGEPGQTGVDERRNAAVTLVTGEIEKFHRTRRAPLRHLLDPAGRSHGPPAATRQQVATSLRCMQQAKRQGRAAWAVWQVGGVDATVFVGLASSRFSDLHLVDTGSAPDDLAFRLCRGRASRRTARSPAATSRLTPRACARPWIAFTTTSLVRSARTPLERPMPGVHWLRRRINRRGLDGHVQALVARGREALRTSQGVDWPLCPIHRTHALVLRDQHWFCDVDAAVVAPLGRLRRLRPAKPLP